MSLSGPAKVISAALFGVTTFAIGLARHYTATEPLDQVDKVAASCDFNGDNILDITEATMLALEQLDLNGDRKIIDKEEITKAREIRDNLSKFRYNLLKSRANLELACLQFSPFDSFPVLSEDGTHVTVRGGPGPFEIYRDKNGQYRRFGDADSITIKDLKLISQ